MQGSLDVSLAGSSKGKNILMVNNYKFHKKFVQKSGVVKWVCDRYGTHKDNCKSLCYTQGETTMIMDGIFDHNHEANAQKYMRNIISNSCKKLARENPFEKPKHIMKRKIETAAISGTITKKDVHTIRKIIWNTKRNKLQHLSNPTEDAQEILDCIPSTESINEKLFLIENDHEKNIVVFGWKNGIDYLKQAETIFVDGISKYGFKSCKQLFTILVEQNGQNIPMFYCLLQDKEQTTFKACFEKIKALVSECQLKLVVTNQIFLCCIIKQVWPNVEIRGGNFHCTRKCEDSELASQLHLSSMTSSMKRARKAGSHTEVESGGAMLVEGDPCTSMSNIQNVTNPCSSTSNQHNLGDPCASTSNMENENDLSTYTSHYKEPEIAHQDVPEFGDFERQISQVSSIPVSTAEEIPAPIQDAVIDERREAPPSITTVSTDSASVKVKPINTLQSIDTSVEERESNQKDGVGTTHIDISVKKLESAIQRLESVSNKLTAASLIDSYDQFGKYISSVLRGLPVRKVHYLKQKIMSDLMDTVSQEVVGIAKTPTLHPTQHTQPTEYAARSDVRFDKDQSNANLPQDPHTFVSRLRGKMPPLYSSVLAPNQQPPLGVPQAPVVAATMGSNILNVPSSCSSDKSSFTMTLKVADRGFTAANAPKSVSAATPSPQSSDPLSPRPSSARGRKRRKTSAVRLDNRKNSGQDFEEMDIKEGVEFARIKQDQYLFETVLCGESSTLYIKEEVPDSEEPPQVSSPAPPPPTTAPQPPVTCHLCSVQCGSREDLTNHLNTKHPGCNSTPDPNSDDTSRDYFKT